MLFGHIWDNILAEMLQKKIQIFSKIGLLQLLNRPSKNICLTIFSFMIYFASKVACALLYIIAIKKIYEKKITFDALYHLIDILFGISF